MQEHIYLFDGFEFDEHDGFIVGNRDGLQELQDAVGSAIRFGESKANVSEFLSEDGDYSGIRCLPDSFFIENVEQNSDEKSGSSATDAFGLAFKILTRVLMFFVPFIIGVVVIIKHIFGLF